MKNGTDVIILGAGMAGLSAARALAQAGMRVLVLESMSRVGGRIHTVRQGSDVVELGAEFIHGRPPELWDLIEEAGLETYERTGDFFRLEDGKLVCGEGDDDDGEDALQELKHFTGPDCSFAAWLDRLSLSEQDRQQQIGYVEGFNAANAEEASAVALGLQQKAEDAIEGDRLWKLAGGYDQLTDYLDERFKALGGVVLTNARAVRVEWTQTQGATIALSDGRAFHAPRCLVTVPLGVLQSRALHFEPAVPSILDAANRMRAGLVCRFTLVFRRRLWPATMSFLVTRGLSPAIWWTSSPAETRTLTGWSGGPRAAQLLALSEADLRSHAISAAAVALGPGYDRVTEEVLSFHTFNWSGDPAYRGAYSWVPVGGLTASEEMSRAAGGVLFFAGEHTDTSGHWGTVHAALRSGLRAAEQIAHGFPS